MMASVDPIAALDRLLVDDPHAAGIDELMAVAGDLLQTRGERIRGELLGLELALRSAASRQAVQDRKRDLEAWLEAHEAAVFGRVLAALRQRPGALRPRIRGGRIWALHVDLRRIPMSADGLSLQDLIQVLARAPLLRGIEALQIRTRRYEDAAAVTNRLLAEAAQLPMLEQLLVSMSTRPLGHLHRAAPARQQQLRLAFPRLWLASEHNQLLPIFEADLDDDVGARMLDTLDDGPMTRDKRVLIGRGLTCGRRETTLAAVERLIQLGASSQVFLPTLLMMLKPQVSHAAPWLLLQLHRLRPWAPELTVALRRITGGVDRYPQEVRALAGRALRAHAIA